MGVPARRQGVRPPGLGQPHPRPSVRRGVIALGTRRAPSAADDRDTRPESAFDPGVRAESSDHDPRAALGLAALGVHGAGSARLPCRPVVVANTERAARRPARRTAHRPPPPLLNLSRLVPMNPEASPPRKVVPSNGSTPHWHIYACRRVRHPGRRRPADLRRHRVRWRVRQPPRHPGARAPERQRPRRLQDAVRPRRRAHRSPGALSRPRPPRRGGPRRRGPGRPRSPQATQRFAGRRHRGDRRARGRAARADPAQLRRRRAVRAVEPRRRPRDLQGSARPRSGAAAPQAQPRRARQAPARGQPERPLAEAAPRAGPRARAPRPARSPSGLGRRPASR